MARYDALRKIDRNKELIAYWKSHGELSYKEIGAKFGITEARAWRICHPKSTVARNNGDKPLASHFSPVPKPKYRES